LVQPDLSELEGLLEIVSLEMTTEGVPNIAVVSQAHGYGKSRAIMRSHLPGRGDISAFSAAN